MDGVNQNQHLQLDRSTLERISSTELMPGDVVCTYESLTTSPANIQAIRAQSLTKAGRKSNLANMLHFQVVLGKTANPNIISVAHASGIAKRVLKEEQDLSSFPYGTALVVFRPKDKKSAAKICEIAERTATQGETSWGIKAIESFTNMAKHLIPKPEKKHLRKLAQLTVDSTSNFKKKDGTKKTMSCVQYCNAIINAAHLSSNPDIQQILESDEERETKIGLLELYLKDHGVDPTLHFDRDVTSAGLADTLLHDENWEKVGYIGSIADGLVQQPEIVKTGANPINLEWISSNDFGSAARIRKVFQELNLIDADNYLLGFHFEKKTNLKAALSYLYAETRNLNVSILLNFLSDPEVKKEFETFEIQWQTFRNKFGKNISSQRLKDLKEIFIKGKKTSPYLKEAFFSGRLSLYLKMELYTNEQIDNILALEKGTKIPPFKSTPTKFSDHLYRVSPNLMAIKKAILDASKPNLEESAFEYLRTNHAIRRLQGKDNQNMKIAAVALVVIAAVIAPFFLEVAIAIAALVAIGFLLHSVYKNQQMQNWMNKNHNLYRREKENIAIPIENLDPGFGNRPWITYTLDGETWFYKPARMLDTSGKKWEVTLSANSKFEYKVFVGPHDCKSANPTAGARWQKGDNIKVVADEIEEEDRIINKDGRLVIKPPQLELQ